jgi:hypothetical protein
MVAAELVAVGLVARDGFTCLCAAFGGESLEVIYRMTSWCLSSSAWTLRKFVSCCRSERFRSRKVAEVDL